MTNPALRSRYLAETVATASPGQLLVMLYDRLVVDLTQAEDAMRAGDRPTSSARLMHAQDIVSELRGSLDVAAWDGAAGLAQQLDTVAKGATDPITGTLTAAIKGGNTQITSLNRQIADWDVRLAARQQALQRQFTNLELALGKMKNQSNWLSGQIAGLPSGGQ